MLLQVGSSGADVKKLQTQLGLTADGDFGPKTKASVIQWQTENNLPADGIVKDADWSILFPQPVSSGDLPFNIESLRSHVPDAVIDQIPDTAVKFHITNTLRLAHFLAQCKHESGGFAVVKENLNYSAARLKQVFPKYFPDNLGDSYSNNPAKIGSRIYANRMGNGDEDSGDGYSYRGRGFIQLTGKNNYSNFAEFIGEDTVAYPDLVATKYPLASAAFFFNSNNLWAICDNGASEDVVTQVTKRVNGGTLGLAERLKNFNDFYAILK